MALTLLNFPTMVSNAAAAAQAACSKLLNLAVGSVTRAILEANASVGMWIQYLVVQIWLSERLATSQGPEVDSFVNDFGLIRLPATPATGSAIFSRFYSGMTALIVPYFNADGSVNTSGVQVITADLSQSFGVTTDTTNPAWSASMGGYVLASGVSSINVTVQALVAGSAGNIQAGALSLIATSVPGVDTVTNPIVFSDGEDAETDSALRARFQNFIATLAEGTVGAIKNAISSVQQGLSYNVIENTMPSGATTLGFFTITVDDGTGSPSAALIAAVSQAVNKVRPIGSSFAVQGPAVIVAVISMSITASAGYSLTALETQVATVIEEYINGLGIGVALSYTRLSALAYSVAGVATVNNVTLNGGTSDIGGGPTQTVKATGSSILIN